MDTRPDERDDITQPRLGPWGTLRFVWRQLTSMRTALLLLLLLAVAAVPGSIWPQRGIDAAGSATYLDQHPTPRAVAGPARLLRRLRLAVVLRDLPAAVRVAGRLRAAAVADPLARHARPAAARAAAARAPARARRAAGGGVGRGDGGGRPGGAAGQALPHPQGVDGEDPHTLSGESGYLRETGNLVFHTRADRGHRRHRDRAPVRLARRPHRAGGETFSNTISAYDTLDPGPWVDTEALHAVLGHDRQARRQLRGAGPRRAVRCPPRLHRAHDDDRGPGRSRSASRR